MTTHSKAPAGVFPKLRLVEPAPRADAAEAAHADLSERVLLSACLLDASLLAGFDWLAPEHFRLGQHARIWEALSAFRESARDPLPAAPCLVDVARQLQLAGRLREVGGQAALALLVDQAPDVVDLEAHAESVHAAFQQRRLASWAASLEATARTTPTAPDALLEGAASAIADLQAQQRTGQPPGSLLGDAASSWVTSLEAPELAPPVLATGFRDIDAFGGGMGRGGLWVLGGRPGMGKTALAMNVGMNVAWSTESVAVFSLEMSRAELAARSLASESGVPTSGEITPEARVALREASDRLRRLPLWIDDTPGLSLAELQRRARALSARARQRGRRLSLVVVDYLQLIGVPHVAGRRRTDEIGEVSKALKVLARQLDCVVLALAQLNRESEHEQRRPRMTDLRDCGQIEQDADWVGILWRQRETPYWQTDLAICKQRKGPKDADLRLGWQPELTRFDDG